MNTIKYETPLPFTVGSIKEPIQVWRRGRWRSMPHLRSHLDDGSYITRCGLAVELGASGVDAMVLTQIPGRMFMNVGCGHCRQALLADLRVWLQGVQPNAKAELDRALDKAGWITVS